MCDAEGGGMVVLLGMRHAGGGWGLSLWTERGRGNGGGREGGRGGGGRGGLVVALLMPSFRCSIVNCLSLFDGGELEVVG